MFSQALGTFTKLHGNVLNDATEIINSISSKPKVVLMHRLLVVSLAAFWEAFHEDLCRETLAHHPNPPKNAENFIDTFNNPNSSNITKLYRNVLGVANITDAWYGNALIETGQTPDAFCATIDRMMDLRHDTAHGKWKRPILPMDCVEFLGTIMYLAIRTDERISELFPKPI